MTEVPLRDRNWVLDVVLVYQGSVNTAMARMAELFRDAVIANAPNVVLSPGLRAEGMTTAAGSASMYPAGRALQHRQQRT